MLLEGLSGSDKSGSDADGSVPAAITDTGCERDLNEDRYAVIECASGVAWIVCDGMGGVAGGELAAQLALDAMRRDLESLQPRPPDVALKSSILEANRIIVLRRQNPAFSGMGTTVVAGLFNGPELSIAHAGDSRAYLVRDCAIQQLTVDHTYVQDLVDSGKIAPDEALSHPQAHVLTRCIGSEPALEVDVQKFWIWDAYDGEPTDCLLLCTDGLYSLVTEGEMATIISEKPPQRVCIELVELAKSRGGYDNITCAVIPLGGQMRSEPPPGYQSTLPQYPDSKQKSQALRSGQGVLTKVVIVLMLCVLTVLVTGVLFAALKLA